MKPASTFKKKLRDDKDAPSSYFYDDDFRDPDSRYINQSLYDEADALEWQRMFGLSKSEPEKQLEALQAEIKLRAVITINEIFKIGQLLICAKNICQQQGKKFQEWIKNNLDFSYETANNFMNVYQQCLGQRSIALKIKPSILYKISAPNFPDELREYLFDGGQLDEMTNGRLREITRRYKEGGFKAIENDIQELTRGRSVIKQSCITLDIIENALRMLEATKENIEKRGTPYHSGIVPFEKLIQKNEPEALEINSKLYSALQSAIDILDNARKESEVIVENLKNTIYEKCGVVESDGRIGKRKMAEM